LSYGPLTTSCAVAMTRRCKLGFKLTRPELRSGAGDLHLWPLRNFAVCATSLASCLSLTWNYPSHKRGG